MIDLGRTAIVTGGAGGIGVSVTRRLADVGYSVVVADINDEAARTSAAGLPVVGQAKHSSYSGDLADSGVNRRLAEHAAEIAPIGIIVNAVGISPKDNGRKRSFFDISGEEWDQTMNINVRAPFLLVREAFRLMATDGRSSIVNLLSITSKLGTGGPPGASFPPFLPSSIAYAASKAALQNLTASLSRELAPYKIRVNGVAPGFVATTMLGGMPDEQRMLSQVPSGRFGRPEEIADAIEFLVSERASYINGASIDINGGWLTC